MTHYLRDKRGNTVVDVEAMYQNMSCVVVIEHYTDKLLSLDEEHREKFTQDMQATQEIRASYFENSRVLPNSDDVAKLFLLPIAKRWDLAYVTD